METSNLVVLGIATDAAAVAERGESKRFEALGAALASIGVAIEISLNLLGRYDYLLVLKLPADRRVAFKAMSLIAQSGMMRTESFVALDMTEYFELAGAIDPEVLASLR